ncbi:transposase family protein [Streptomyces sp. NPDC056161]|uniref:transposase family protein n=1 Tax=Streptomyces sp. NPDC056161 TaxID=3345732 RepID=UPI0035DBFC73
MASSCCSTAPSSAPADAPDENRPNYSGKHKAHGLLFLALTDECGSLVWLSAAKPGRSSEITTARHNKITGHQGPHECPTRDHAAADAPRTDERRGPPLTDDHLLPITPPTGTSIAAKPHTSPTTSDFKMKCPQ